MKYRYTSPPKPRKTTFRYTSRDGLIALDADGCLTFANDVARVMLELTNHDLQNKLCADLFDAHDVHGNHFCFRSCTLIAAPKKQLPGQNIDLEVTTRSGTRRWFNVSSLLEKRPRPIDPVIIYLFRPIAHPVSRDGAIAEGVRTSSPTDPIGARIAQFPLTRRQREILALLVQGLVAKEIGVRLNIATATVRTHIQQILTKLGVHSRLEAVTLVFRQLRR